MRGGSPRWGRGCWRGEWHLGERGKEEGLKLQARTKVEESTQVIGKKEASGGNTGLHVRHVAAKMEGRARLVHRARSGNDEDEAQSGHEEEAPCERGRRRSGPRAIRQKEI